MDLNKEIWEGWKVKDFIEDLEWSVKSIMSGQSITTKFQNKEELKKWCIDNQPNYKKHIPELVDYFANMYNLR